MKILDVFDTIREGSFADFLYFYDGDVNKICDPLDINYSTRKEGRNALHLFYFCNFRLDIEYALEVTKLLIDYKININAYDKYGRVPLSYAITINKNPTLYNKKLYEILIKSGSDYTKKDIFGKSCLDYAKELSWRNDLIDIIKNYKIED